MANLITRRDIEHVIQNGCAHGHRWSDICHACREDILTYIRRLWLMNGGPDDH